MELFASSRVLRKIKSVLGFGQTSVQGHSLTTQAGSALEVDCLEWLPKSQLGSADGSGSFDRLFGGFYAKYISAKNSNSLQELQQLREQLPNLYKFGGIVSGYFDDCRTVDAPLKGALTRLLYQVLPYFQNEGNISPMQVKATLPRLGLFYFPNPEPLEFLLDAVRGEFNVEIIEPGAILQEFWQGREVDYACYEQALKEKVGLQLERFVTFADLPPQVRHEAVDLMSKHIQFQMAMTKCVKEKRWDLLMIGAMEMSLGLTLQDIDRAIRPPLVMFYHGVPTGEPMENLFSSPDYLIVRAASELEFYRQLGIPDAQTLRVGSLSREAFPLFPFIESSRRQARANLGFEDRDIVVIWALTYTLGYYDALSDQDCLNLIIKTFEHLAAKPEYKDRLVLYLKYHPAPRPDKTFSFSRSQFPLSSVFQSLNALGVRVYVHDQLNEIIHAADALLAHESTILFEAVEAAVPTVSLKMIKGPSEPVLGSAAYSLQNTHRFCAETTTVDQFSSAFEHVFAITLTERFSDSQKVWSEVYCCGRTAGLVALLEFLKSIASERK